MKAVYKIENKINHKIYIGVSNNPERRWREHIRRTESYTSLIHQAIKKWGEENFSFSIIGWYEDYEEKEKYYISFYRSLVPNGYNIAKGGNNPPSRKGEENSAAVITQQTANKIIEQLLDWRIPQKTIVKNNRVTQDIVRHIKEGDSWRKEELTYPLRPNEKTIDKYRVDYIRWACCFSDTPLNDLGKKVGWGRSSAKMINQGKNHFDERFHYPLRANKEYNKQIINQETCIDYLHFGE